MGFVKAFSKYYNFHKILLWGNEVFAHLAQFYRGYLGWAINPKVQTASGWNVVFCPLILKCITGKKNQEILRWWVTNLSFFGDLRRNYPQHIFSIVADLLQSTPSEDCLLIRKNTRLEILKTVELKNVVLLVMKNM